MVDKIVSTAPERIYLVGGDDCPGDVDFRELDDVTWHSEPAGASVEYMRTDLSIGADALKVMTEAVASHAYIVATITGGRPDLALAESSKWVDIFTTAGDAIRAKDGEK